MVNLLLLTFSCLLPCSSSFSKMFCALMIEWKVLSRVLRNDSFSMFSRYTWQVRGSTPVICVFWTNYTQPSSPTITSVSFLDPKEHFFLFFFSVKASPVIFMKYFHNNYRSLPLILWLWNKVLNSKLSFRSGAWREWKLCMQATIWSE